eukprot:9956378-Lingulodinium_polyedra.AAC.1
MGRYSKHAANAAADFTATTADAGNHARAANVATVAITGDCDTVFEASADEAAVGARAAAAA